MYKAMHKVTPLLRMFGRLKKNSDVRNFFQQPKMNLKRTHIICLSTWFKCVSLVADLKNTNMFEGSNATQNSLEFIAPRNVEKSFRPH